MLSAEEKIGGMFVVEVGGMPGYKTAYLRNCGQELTDKIEEAGQWRGEEVAERVASRVEK